MTWKWHGCEAAILIIVALFNSYWIDNLFIPPPSIYVIGIVQALTTILVLLLSRILFHKNHRATISLGKNNRRQE